MTTKDWQSEVDAAAEEYQANNPPNFRAGRSKSYGMRDIQKTVTFGASWAREKLERELEAVKAALEDRDKMHEEHVRRIEALRMRITVERDELKELVKHALELGHLGEGSTATWARKALEEK